MFKLKGIYPPTPTPFDESGNIAWAHLESNIDFWCSTGLSGLVVMGSNGEFVTLSWAEKLELIERSCSMAKGRKPIVVGCGCEGTRDTIALCKHSAKSGAAAALVLNPNYYKAAVKDDMLREYYTEVADASPIPVIIYNMPGNTGVNLSAALVASLAGHPNIIGIKDSGGNIVQISEILRDVPEDFSVFAGSCSYLYATLALGGVGGTLALANVLPELCVQVQTYVDQNKHAEAAALQKKLLAANAAVTTRFGIAGLKAAVEMVGLYGGPPRRPLLPLSANDRQILQKILDEAASIVI